MTMKDAENRDFTSVSAEYKKDGDDTATASVLMWDFAGADSPYKQQWGTFRSYESTDGWWKSVTVKGQPGWKSYTKSSSSYAEWVQAGDRILVVTSVDHGTEADLDALVNAIDFAGIAALK